MEMLIGNLTRNAQTKVTSKGKTVVNFSIAINDSYQSNGETITNTTYVECGYWTKGNIAPYLESGTLLVLYGRLLEPSAFINEQGEAQASNRFFVERMKFVNSKNKNRAEIEKETFPAYSNAGGAVAGVTAAGVAEADDLPF